MRREFLLLAVALAPSILPAQVKLEVTPFFTSYFPGALTKKSTDTTERQEAGPGIGAALTYRFNNVVGVQGVVAQVWSGNIPRYPVQSGGSTGTINTNFPQPGTMTFAMLRGTLQPRRSNYFLAAGLGQVKRGGQAWDNPQWTKLTNTTMSLGFGIRARVTPTFAFNIGVDGNFYYSDFDPNQPSTSNYYPRRFQRDILVSIGVPYALIER
jgi:hypothetical protein